MAYGTKIDLRSSTVRAVLAILALAFIFLGATVGVVIVICLQRVQLDASLINFLGSFLGGGLSGLVAILGIVWVYRLERSERLRPSVHALEVHFGEIAASFQRWRSEAQGGLSLPQRYNHEPAKQIRLDAIGEAIQRIRILKGTIPTVTNLPHSLALTLQRESVKLSNDLIRIEGYHRSWSSGHLGFGDKRDLPEIDSYVKRRTDEIEAFLNDLRNA